MALMILAVLGSLSPAQDLGTEKVLLGPISVEQLIDLPDWFGADFMSYIPSSEFTADIPGAMGDVEILCVLGTWCSDSKREIPRMIRIMQVTGIDPAKLRMVGADKNKMTPGGESAQYRIEKVPTFIFLRGGTEVGRIVESPTHTLEQDMLAIVNPQSPALQTPQKIISPVDPPPPPHPEPPPPVPVEPSDAATTPDGAVK